MENWRDIPGLEGFYQASDLGRIRSVERVLTLRNGRVLKYKGRVLKPAIHCGYPAVNVCVLGKCRLTNVHRLVCRAFHGEGAPGQEVAHNDGIKMNARADNLRWASKLENEADKVRHGTIRSRDKGHGKISREAWAVIANRRLAGEPKATIAADYGISPDYVRRLTKCRVEGRETIV